MTNPYTYSYAIFLEENHGFSCNIHCLCEIGTSRFESFIIQISDFFSNYTKRRRFTGSLLARLLLLFQLLTGNARNVKHQSCMMGLNMDCWGWRVALSRINSLEIIWIFIRYATGNFGIYSGSNLWKFWKVSKEWKMAVLDKFIFISQIWA